MAYVIPNFKTKKQLREAVKNNQAVKVFQPGPFADNFPESGTTVIEGPHYPEPHQWYAKVEYKDRKVVKVLS